MGLSIWGMRPLTAPKRGASEKHGDGPVESAGTLKLLPAIEGAIYGGRGTRSGPVNGYGNITGSWTTAQQHTGALPSLS